MSLCSLRANEVKEANVAEKHRDLRFRIAEGFGAGLSENIEAVLRSCAETIWQHCPSTHWQVSGFSIYQNNKYPICHFEHTEDSRILIGLATRETFWVQYAFQFAHEFCHALIGHSNDWTKRNRSVGGPNFWLEECLCEVASLFSLRAMSEAWKTRPPYVNWKDFAPKLKSYADERLEKAKQTDSQSFGEWFHSVEKELRVNAIMREHNCRIAFELLPIWEAHPAGWDALQTYRMEVPQDGQNLNEHFAQWLRNSDHTHHAFIRKIGQVFDVKIV